MWMSARPGQRQMLFRSRAVFMWRVHAGSSFEANNEEMGWLRRQGLGRRRVCRHANQAAHGFICAIPTEVIRMKILAGGPSRDMTTELFKWHRRGLVAQSSADLLVEVRHELVTDPGTGARWTGTKIEKVAECRQGFLDETYLDGYDGLFMVDDDVLCGPGVLARLWAVDADVVYGVFWTETEWGQPSGYVAPQVWDMHPYGFSQEKWWALKEEGVNEIEVYGGGACTLIRGRGLDSMYHPLLESVRYIGGMWAGEDRTYALGCECRGIEQIAVTGLPIVHCYSEDRIWTEEHVAMIGDELGI